MGLFASVDIAQDVSLSNWPGLKPGVEGAPLKKSGGGGLEERNSRVQCRWVNVLQDADCIVVFGIADVKDLGVKLQRDGCL